MQLRTKARDCLYLNWALPRSAAPELPQSLRYERHRWQGEDWVFVSVLLFRFIGLRPRWLPFFRLSYPQVNLRLYVLDDDDLPSVLFRRLVVPTWVAPMVWLAGRPSAVGGRLDFPSHADLQTADRWGWRLGGRRGFEVEAGAGSPQLGFGPDLGGWQPAVDYFRRRQRGYVIYDGVLRPISRSHPPVEAVPTHVDIVDRGFLSSDFPAMAPDHWRLPHSSWLCPEQAFRFELGKALVPELAARQVAVPDSC